MSPNPTILLAMINHNLFVLSEAKKHEEETLKDLHNFKSNFDYFNSTIRPCIEICLRNIHNNNKQRAILFKKRKEITIKEGEYLVSHSPARIRVPCAVCGAVRNYVRFDAEERVNFKCDHCDGNMLGIHSWGKRIPGGIKLSYDIY
jgi:hypothetical protein